jgi:hypothetical protein
MGTRTDLIVHFHGWNNNIDSTLRQYQLVEQLVASRKNAILVVPEGPRNAPDSFGGKLEDPEGFKTFISDVLASLAQHTKSPVSTLGNIILSGHSGGYHVMSFILLHGGLTDHVKEVFLFDALYGQTEKYAFWLDHSDGRMINIYTDDGGTKQESLSLMEDLRGWGISFLSKEEADATPADLRNNRIVFLHTSLVHNEVVNKDQNFQKYLEASPLLDILP